MDLQRASSGCSDGGSESRDHARAVKAMRGCGGRRVTRLDFVDVQHDDGASVSGMDANAPLFSRRDRARRLAVPASMPAPDLSTMPADSDDCVLVCDSDAMPTMRNRRWGEIDAANSVRRAECAAGGNAEHAAQRGLHRSFVLPCFSSDQHASMTMPCTARTDRSGYTPIAAPRQSHTARRRMPAAAPWATSRQHLVADEPQQAADPAADVTLVVDHAAHARSSSPAFTESMRHFRRQVDMSLDLDSFFSSGFSVAHAQAESAREQRLRDRYAARRDANLRQRRNRRADAAPAEAGTAAQTSAEMALGALHGAAAAESSLAEDLAGFMDDMPGLFTPFAEIEGLPSFFPSASIDLADSPAPTRPRSPFPFRGARTQPSHQSAAARFAHHEAFAASRRVTAVREMLLDMTRTGLPPHLLFSDRDFTADDYEWLCRLDDTVENRKGASQTEIDNMPTQVIDQAAKDTERCVICLEQPQMGEVLRTLPCKHAFHRDCIDSWLKQKAVCPICQVSCKQP